MKKLLIAIAAVLLVGVGGYAIYDNVSNDSAQSSSQSQTTESTKQTGATLAYTEDGKKVSYNGVEGVTALKALQDATEVATEESQYGEFVTGINGVVADSSTEYWSFYVNGSYASEGAGTYVMKAADKIEWRLEKL